MKPRQRAFLAAYVACGVVAEAARISKTSKAAHYASLQENPEYAKAFEEAKEDATQFLETQAHNLATVGHLKPVFSRGQLVFEPARDATTGDIIRDPETGRVVYSDTIMMTAEPNPILLMFLLKSKRPIYRDNASLELSGSGGGPISVSVEFVKAGS